MVADYGTGTLDEGAEAGPHPDGAPPPATPDSTPGALCGAEIPWPPDDGRHRVECGAMTLVVETRMIDNRKKGR